MTLELRYCPVCAGGLEIRSAGHPPSLQPVCEECGFVLWQNPKPSVEALILRGAGAGAEILLGQRGIEPAKVRWDVPGGFLNLGDEPEAALIRECRREFGVSVRVCELVAAFTDTFEGGMLALYYRCEIKSGLPRAADIVDAVSWFPVLAPPEMAFKGAAKALRVLQQHLE